MNIYLPTLTDEEIIRTDYKTALELELIKRLENCLDEIDVEFDRADLHEEIDDLEDINDHLNNQVFDLQEEVGKLESIIESQQDNLQLLEFKINELTNTLDEALSNCYNGEQKEL